MGLEGITYHIIALGSIYTTKSAGFGLAINATAEAATVYAT